MRNSNEESAVARLCREFAEGGHFPRYLLGRTPPYATSVPGAVDGRLDGVLDEFTKNNTAMGLPVVHSISALPPGAVVLSAAMLNPTTARRKLDAAGVRCIEYYSMLRHCPERPFRKVIFWEGFRESWATRRAEYDALEARLSDGESKDVLRRLIAFRLTGDIGAMDCFTPREKEQYFEDFLGLVRCHSFADVGGFDGYTSAEFAKRCPDYRKIWFFEPEERNLVAARVALAGLERIEWCTVAASDRAGELRFSPSADASKVSADGDVVVKAGKIDDFVPRGWPDLFMKMDIEGAEGTALAGAAETIRTCHPVLAIAVYHKGADLIDIPKQVLSYCNGYRLFLRHYTEGLSETDMFFVPEER